MQKLLVLYIWFLLLLPFLVLGMGVEKGPEPVFSETSQLSLEQYCLIVDSLEKTESTRLLNKIAEKRSHNNFESAKEFALEALLHARANNQNKELADAYQNLGDIAWNENNFSEATSHYYQARELREQISDSIGIISSNISIGNVYLRQNHFRDAEHYYSYAASLSQKKNYQIGIIDSDIALGKLSAQQKEVRKAQHYFQKALMNAKRQAYTNGEIKALVFLGKQYLSENNNDGAYLYFSDALEKIRAQNDQYNIAKVLSLLAQSMMHKKETLEKSRKMAEESLLLSENMKMLPIQIEALTVLSTVYYKLGKLEKAYTLEKQKFKLHQRLTSEVMEQSIAAVQMNDLAKERSVHQLKTSNELLKKNQEITRLIQWIIYISLLCIAIVIVVFHSRLQLKTKSNQQLEKINKELRETNETLERFAYAASHDLREPLRTISSFTSLIAQKYGASLDKKGLEYFDFIVKGVDHMKFLLEDLLRYSRVVHKKEFTSESVNLNQVIVSVENALSYTIGERNAILKYPKLPIIHSNPVQMHQLFQNLIANGLKFNDKEQPVIEIDCQKTETNYLFAIKDNGIGIDKQYQHKVFEMFQRLSKRDYDGTGIGLAIVKKIVDLNQGQLWLESTIGEGSTFYFSLPATTKN